MNLNQVTLPSTDVARSIAFYRRLGLELIVASAPRYARFACPDGGATLSVHHVDQAPPDSPTVIYFECEQLDEKVAQLKQDGIAFESDPVDQDWLWREATLLDPDRNRICLYHAGQNRLDPPWRVTALA
ncbi:VOC family protein [Undibacterium arcticum]|uniref:VOC family protein n=1 Tax=Undibacterium arcticum TaxID=1762892 RepID=A0ABV7F0J6_9BURK